MFEMFQSIMPESDCRLNIDSYLVWMGSDCLAPRLSSLYFMGEDSYTDCFAVFDNPENPFDIFFDE